MAKLQEVVGEIEYIEGSVSGLLQRLNIYGSANTFYIFPVAGPKKVKCIFPEGIRKKALESVGRYINLKGKLKYREKENHPFEISATEIEVYPEESDLPSLFDIRGIAPNITGGIPSEEYIRRKRCDE